jgi:hypothetical protein
MDVEKTMQFILETQARTDVQLQRVDHQLEKLAERENRAEIRLGKMERKQDATMTIIKAGMKILLKHDNGIKELIKAQGRTDEKLNRFIDSLSKQHRNGH